MADENPYRAPESSTANQRESIWSQLRHRAKVVDARDLPTLAIIVVFAVGVVAFSTVISITNEIADWPFSPQVRWTVRLASIFFFLMGAAMFGYVVYYLLLYNPPENKTDADDESNPFAT